MSLSNLTVLGIAILAGLGGFGIVLYRAARAFLAYRGTRVVVCPEAREMAAIEVDASRAAALAVRGGRELSLHSCSRWPERRGCGQQCLTLVESAPEACLLRTILEDWYRDKRCVFCACALDAPRWHDHRPALLSPEGHLLSWSAFPPEQVLDVLATHRPVCWDCRVAEGFRREHPELVTDRAAAGPPPSMS